MPPCGGCGSYSIASWIMRATLSLVSMAASRRAVSIPADTPAPVR
jgi:hypothetical protein